MSEADVEGHAVRKYLKCQIILQACENQVVAQSYFGGVWRW